jgi:hypothetical protein
VVDLADPQGWNLVHAQSSGCGSGTPDENCGNGNADQNCGETLTSGGTDTDEACSATDTDENCGKPLASGGTDPDEGCSATDTDENCGKPLASGGTDPDEGCSATDNDENCQASQLPNPGQDIDQNCSDESTDPDQSCGDCDDTHHSDQHCGIDNPGGETDADDLCGHQSNIGGDTDNVCSTEEADVGCGTHKAKYGTLPFNDEDEHCGQMGDPDMNCGDPGETSDENCNAPANPSTTSPDERCSATDVDEACSRYDADESCGNGNADEACGTYKNPIPGFPDFKDNDDNCGNGTDADDSENPNKGPIKPWCGSEDPDFWNPEE